MHVQQRPLLAAFAVGTLLAALLEWAGSVVGQQHGPLCPDPGLDPSAPHPAPCLLTSSQRLGAL